MDRSSFAGLGFFSLGSLGDGARAPGLDGRQVGLWPVVWRIRVQHSESSGSGSGHSGQFMVWGSFGSACHWHCCGKPLVVQSHHRPRHGDADEGPIYHACDSSMQTSCVNAAACSAPLGTLTRTSVRGIGTGLCAANGCRRLRKLALGFQVNQKFTLEALTGTGNM